jgi:ABC-type sugar transport system ATPase subunit
VDLDDGKFRFGDLQFDVGLRRTGRVTVGIRPEALQPGSGIKGGVRWIEALGANFLVGVKVGETDLSVLMRGRPAADTIELSIDPAEIHVFDKDSGENLRSHPV